MVPACLQPSVGKVARRAVHATEWDALPCVLGSYLSTSKLANVSGVVFASGRSGPLLANTEGTY